MEFDCAYQGPLIARNTMRFDTAIKVRIRDAYAARHEPEATRVLARIYWTVIVVLLALVVAASIIYGAWEFFQTPVQDENALNVHPQAIFTRAQLQGILDGFDARSERFELRMTAPAAAKDPS